MNVFIERVENSPEVSGVFLLPNERVRLTATDIGPWAVGVVFRAWNEYGEEILDKSASIQFSMAGPWAQTYATFPRTGTYILQAFESGVSRVVSDIYHFTVTSNAPPPSRPNPDDKDDGPIKEAADAISNTIKWVAIGAVVVAVGYVVVRSGALDTGASVAKKKLQARYG